MTLTISVSPQMEAWLNEQAARQGLPPNEIIRRIVDERQHKATAFPDNVAEEDTTIALLQSWIEQDATDDPAKIRKAEEELREFKRNMNAPRKEVGERLHFPEVERD